MFFLTYHYNNTFGLNEESSSVFFWSCGRWDRWQIKVSVFDGTQNVKQNRPTFHFIIILARRPLTNVIRRTLIVADAHPFCNSCVGTGFTIFHGGNIVYLRCCLHSVFINAFEWIKLLVSLFCTVALITLIRQVWTPWHRFMNRVYIWAAPDNFNLRTWERHREKKKTKTELNAWMTVHYEYPFGSFCQLYPVI